ncbi:hypothetical protein TYRP_000486 [Tyrophagus putrescentiae]|nr:hypothetical protein TYRP_000486 [Tyrophagus putrescentiae]
MTATANPVAIFEDLPAAINMSKKWNSFIYGGQWTVRATETVDSAIRVYTCSVGGAQQGAGLTRQSELRTSDSGGSDRYEA